MKTTFLGVCLVALAVSLLATSSAQAITEDIANVRGIYIGEGGAGGNESYESYYIHRPFQQAELIQPDLAAYAGMDATTDGTLTIPVTAFFSHWSSAGSHTLKIWQLGAQNADVDLDDADRFYKDVSTTTPWVKHDSSSLASWDTNSVSSNFYDVLTSAGASPIATATGVTVGNNLVFTIPEAVLDSWLDGSMPGIMVLSNNQHQQNVINAQWSYNLQNTTFEFEAAPVPEPSSFVLAGLGLVGLAGWGLRRRHRG